MKVKSSNKASFLLLLGLSLLIVGLVVISGDKFDISKNSIKKETKQTPITKQNTTLNFIELTLSEKNYNKLKKYRNRALSVGVISAKDKKYVPATITFNGKDYKADIRLKGDWTDHLVGDKWSFRIKLKGDKTIFGMRKFSIHHPKTRGYINEWLFHKANKAEALIGLRYGFVEGAMHIKKEDSESYININLGIYAMEETFDKRMLENNKRKESIIIKFYEENWWNGVKKRIEVGEVSGIKWDKFRTDNTGSWKYPTTVFSESKVLEDSLQAKYFKLSKNLIDNLRNNKLNISEVFNTKQLAMHNALSNLFGAFHGDYIINHRFYYNPISSKLEPISFDGDSGQKLDKFHQFRFVTKNDSIYFKELIKALKKVSTKEYLDNLLKLNAMDLNYFGKTLSEEFLYSELKIKNFKSNQEIIKEELKRLKNTYQTISTEEQFENEDLTLSNNYSKWKMTNTSLVSTNKNYKNYNVFKLLRQDTLNPSYTIIKYITSDFKEDYTASFLVKKATKEGMFAIRIQREYPSRVDAVFDLTKGKVKGVKNTEGFENGKATIKELAQGWYLCSLNTKPNVGLFKVIIGTANHDAEVLDWESKSKINNEILIALKPESK